MNSVALTWHLLNFVVPAAGLAAVMTLALRLRGVRAPSVVKMWGGLCAAGVAVLLAGLWWLERDGAMLTYAALILVNASLAWHWSNK
jgi:hypothetical protein